jgi:uncharacterized membrane protein YtjA (UPF0391 family)
VALFSDKETAMLGWVITFFVLAVAAAVLGFGGLSATFSGIAQILFVVFIALFVVTLVARLMSGRRSI